MFTPEIILYLTSSTILIFVLVRAIANYFHEFSFLAKASSWEDLLNQWIFLAPVCIIISSLLLSGNRMALGSDWPAYYEYHQVVLDSMRKGELLHWSTTISGGYPWAGHPENPSTSISMIPVLLFGVIFGIKVNIAIMELLCLTGTFLLARKYLHLSIFSSALISSMVISSTLIAIRVYSQKYTNIFGFVAPLSIFLFLESVCVPLKNAQYKEIQRFWALCSTAILLSLMLYQGKVAFILTLIILFAIFVYIFFKAGRSDRIKILLTCSIMFTLMLFLAAPKILPMYELLQIDSRFVSDWEKLRNHIYKPSTMIMALISFKYDPTVWVFSNQIIGLGIIPLMLAVFGFFAYPKRASLWLSICVISILIALGDNSILPLGYYLWHLPVFHSMEDLDKYFSIYIMFSIAVLAGFGVEKLRDLRPHGSSIAIVIAIVILAMLSLSSASLHGRAFNSQLPTYEKEKEFYFVERIKDGGFKGYFKEDYFFHLRNIGTLHSYTNIEYPNKAQAKYKLGTDDSKVPNPLYRGEAYVEDGNAVVKTTNRRQNYMELEIVTTKPETLVINQNYNKYWHTSIGEIINDGSGLLKIQLKNPGQHKLTVRNTNVLFRTGYMLALLAVVLLFPVYVLFPKLLYNSKNKNQEYVNL